MLSTPTTRPGIMPVAGSTRTEHGSGGRWYLVELVGGDDLDQVLHCVLDLHVLALVDNAQHHSPQLSDPAWRVQPWRGE